jgi:hypothetical protein
MERSDAYKKFLASKQIAHDQWREGEGYDLHAFAQMTQEEREEVTCEIRQMPRLGWRDLDVLGAQGAPESIERLRHILAERGQPMRTRASALRTLIDNDHTPGSVADVQLSHLIDEIDDDDDLLPALDLASWHGGAMTYLALLRGAQDRPSISLHYAARLLDVAKLSDDMAAFDPKFRPTLLRLLPDNDPADRAAAFNQICEWLGIEPADIPKRGAANERKWAEMKWPRKD